MDSHDEYGLVVVCYDIANDRRRRRVARELEAFGVRVQESVFECWVANAALRRLRAAIAAHIRPDADSVAYYRLPPSACDDALVIGGVVSSDLRVFVV